MTTPAQPATCHPDRPARTRGLCNACYQHEQYWKNPERYRAYQAKYLKEDPERVRARLRKSRSKPENKARARARRKVYTALHPEKFRKAARDWTHKNRIKVMVHNARKRSKQVGMDFSITYSDISLPELCPVLGIPLKFGEGKLSDFSPTIDRIDSAKGYVPGNVLVISHRANRIKNDANLSDILLIADYMMKHANIGKVS
jgi:hypothetical protein